ncbi:MAG: SPOR domain-containing protein [Beijerinckiaceae bacterium]|nr:SPOR domain-containing protein [Beijerinckiaceae bacterium]
MSEPIVKRRPMIDLEEFERRLRKPLALNQEDNDPLAELARFIGEQDNLYRADPYKTVFEPLSRQPDESFRGGPVQGEVRERSSHEPLIRGDFAAVEAGLLGTVQSEDTPGQLGGIELDRGGDADGMTHWPYADDAAGYGENPPFEEIRSRRPIYVMYAVILAGTVGISASFALKGSVSIPDEVATIRAADGPVKVQPVAASGNENPSPDATILGGSPQQPPIGAVSNVEQPADLSAQAEVPEAQNTPLGSAANIAAGAASVPVPPPPVPAQAQPAAEPQTIAQLIEPKKVKTVSVRPDGTLVPAEAQPQAAAPATRPAPAPAPRAATPKTVARVAATPKPAAVDATGNPQTTTAAKAKRAEPAGAREGAAAAGGSPGAFAVQLAAPSSEQEARDLQTRLMKKFGTELAGFQPSIHKAAVGGKEVYRVRVVGLSSREQATALCQKVQSSGGNCFVAKY